MFGHVGPVMPIKQCVEYSSSGRFMVGVGSPDVAFLGNEYHRYIWGGTVK